jgi:hypothetical protein
MISPAGAILLALLLSSLVVIAMFLRLIWEDGEAVDIGVDEIEELDILVPVNDFQAAGRKESNQS